MSGLRKVLALGRINLVRQLRDRADAFFVFVLPTIIVLALGLQFGGTSRARLGVVVPPGDVAAAALVQVLAEDPTRFEVRTLPSAAALEEQVARGQLEAGVDIPEGFAAGLAGDGTVEVRYVAPPSSLATGIRAPVDAAIARVAAVAAAARLSVAADLADWDQALAVAEARYQDVPGVEVRVTQVGTPGLFAGFSAFSFGASTQLILFTFLTSMTAAGRLVEARRIGVSRRMTATPTSTWTVVAGEALGRYLVALLQAIYIVVMTALLFQVAWGDPLAAGVVIALFGMVSAGVALLVGALAKTPEQASSMGVFLGLALGALGGCMIPFQVMPDAMQSIARLIPHSWALQGLQELIRGGGGLSTVLPNVAVLFGFAVVLLGLASWRFRKAITG
jgi:ABC-2 type transport system permease protein